MISRLTPELVNPRHRARKCKAKIRKACDQDSHIFNDHCRRHYEFTEYKKDSDHLHSILMAQASNRLPGKFVLHVYCKVRL